MRVFPTLRLTLATSLVALLGACAGPGGDPGLSLEERLDKGGWRIGESVERIPGFGVSGWSYLDERHMQVASGPGQEYLLTFSMPCRDLQTARSVGHTSTLGSLSRLDSVVASGLMGPMRCPIRAIHKLERAATS